MIAVLEWTDSFANETYVKANKHTIQIEKQNYSEGERWEELD